MTLIKSNASNKFSVVHTYKASDVQLLNAHGLEEAAKALVAVNHAAVKQSRLAEALNSLCDELYEVMCKRSLDIPAYNGGDDIEGASRYVSNLYDQLKRELLKTDVQYYTAGAYIERTAFIQPVIDILKKRGNDWTVQAAEQYNDVAARAIKGEASNQEVASAIVNLVQSYEIETMKFVDDGALKEMHDGEEVGLYTSRTLHRLHNSIVKANE